MTITPKCETSHRHQCILLFLIKFIAHALSHTDMLNLRCR